MKTSTKHLLSVIVYAVLLVLIIAAIIWDKPLAIYVVAGAMLIKAIADLINVWRDKRNG